MKTLITTREIMDILQLLTMQYNHSFPGIEKMLDDAKKIIDFVKNESDEGQMFNTPIVPDYSSGLGSTKDTSQDFGQQYKEDCNCGRNN